MKKSTQQHFNNFSKKLICKKTKERISLTRNWVEQFPKEAGVYVLFEKNKLVYVGETSSIKERMTDFLNTRNHTVRRKVGAFNFSEIKGYHPASSRIKFPDHIEKLVIDWLEKKVKLSYLVVDLGRKELEEFIQDKYNPKYNSRRRRGVE